MAEGFYQRAEQAELHHEQDRDAVLTAMLQVDPQTVVDASEYLGRDSRNRAYYREDKVFEEAFGQLPRANLALARDIYTRFAESPVRRLRLMTGLAITALTRVDRSYGLMLWDRLVRDREFYVAEPTMNHPFSSSPDDDECARLGITPNDYRWLFASYEAARQGHNVHDPGQAAYSQLAEVARRAAT